MLLFFHLVVILGLLFRIVNVTFVILRTSSNDYFAIFGEPPLLIGICRSKMSREILNSVNTIRYDTRCYFNVRSKANMSQLNLPHGTDNSISVKTEKILKVENRHAQK